MSSRPTGQATSRHFPTLDGLRGVAILAVIVFHTPLQIVPSGAIGVDMFFVLSGFLITSILLNEHAARGHISLRNFYARRALRLMPGLAAMIVIVASLHSHFAPGFSIEQWKAYAATALYVSNWVRAFSENINVLGVFGVTWSLAVEEQFYLLWPLALFVTLSIGIERERVVVGLVAAIVAISIWRIWPWEHGTPVQRINNGFDTRADALLFGCIISFAPLAAICARPYLRRLLCSMAMAGAAFILAFLPARVSEGFYFGCGMTLVSLSTAAIIGSCVAGVRVPAITRILEARWLRWIGQISYSIYLWHTVVYAIDLPTREWLNVTFSVNALGYGRTVNLTTFWLVRICGAIAIGALSFYAIERPFLRLKRRFSSIPLLPTADSRTPPGSR